MMNSCLLRVLFGLMVITLSASAHADWHRAYAIEWFEPAFYYGAQEGTSAPGTDCPAGTNPDMDWRKVLKTSYRSDQEIERILDPEKPLRSQMAGIRGPNQENVYEKPWSVEDPGMTEVSGNLAYGFDLDGNARTGFTSPEGAKGIDNQYYRVAGCWMAWRGPARNAHHAKYVNDGMRDGAFTALMLVSGHGADADNDSDVLVAFYTSKDKIVKDANGNIAADYTFRVNPDARFQSVIKARTVQGVLEAVAPQELSMRDVETAPFFPPQLKLHQARFRFQREPDGKLNGLIGGYRSIDDYYTGWAAAGAIHELTTHVNMPAYWYALRRNADAQPDAQTKQNMAISTAYRLYLVPAFIVDPNGREEVNAAKIFEGPPQDTPARAAMRRAGGGGAATVYPPPPTFRMKSNRANSTR